MQLVREIGEALDHSGCGNEGKQSQEKYPGRIISEIGQIGFTRMNKYIAVENLLDQHEKKHQPLGKMQSLYRQHDKCDNQGQYEVDANHA